MEVLFSSLWNLCHVWMCYAGEEGKDQWENEVSAGFSTRLQQDHRESWNARWNHQLCSISSKTSRGGLPANFISNSSIFLYFHCILNWSLLSLKYAVPIHETSCCESKAWLQHWRFLWKRGKEIYVVLKHVYISHPFGNEIDLLEDSRYFPREDQF